jgi:uncharacterized protein (TIGR02217 family)
MGNAIYPSLPGITWDTQVAPSFSTKIHRAVSGYEVRAAYMAYPLWKFLFKYELLRDNTLNNEFKKLLGFFNARLGSFDSFLYSNPSDNAVTAHSFGTGNGSTTAFALIRSYAGFVEPVQNLNGVPSVYVNGVLTSCTISGTGTVTFAAAPANGAALTWTGAFYYRCRFLADAIDLNQFMKNLYNVSKLEFIGSPMNKV